MPNAFRIQLSNLQSALVEAILSAARSCPLDELFGTAGVAREERFAPGAGGNGARRFPGSSDESRPRSAEDVGKTLDLVVLLLRGQKGGLRAEHLRQKLGVPKEVMSRVLNQGLASKRITRTGERRTTTYFAVMR